MKQERATEFLKMLEQQVQASPSPCGFEMAYQARIAIEKIKFAIQHTERVANQHSQIVEANFQLLDALDRLQSAERHFQESWRKPRIILQETNDALFADLLAPDPSPKKGERVA